MLGVISAKAFVFNILIYEVRTKYITEKGSLHRNFRCSLVLSSIRAFQVDILGRFSISMSPLLNQTS